MTLQILDGLIFCLWHCRRLCSWVSFSDCQQIVDVLQDSKKL